MAERSLWRSRRFQIASAIAIATVVVTWAAVSGLRRPGATSIPGDMFPANLSAALQVELSRASEEVRQTGTAESWGKLGELCMAHELLPQAKTCFLEASAIAPKEPKWIYLQAVMDEETDLRQAISTYDKVLGLDQSVAAVHFRRGRALVRVGRFEEAERSLETAAKMSDQHPLVLKAIAQLMIMQHQVADGVELIKKAARDSRAGRDIIQEAQHLQARHARGEKAATAEETDNQRPQITAPLPEPWMDGVVRKSPQMAEVAAQAGILASQQRYQASLRMYERLLRMEDRNSRPHTYHAMVLMQAGKLQEALGEISKVCEEFPGDALAFSSRGAIEARMGDFAASVVSLRKAVEIKPDFEDAHRALLMIFLQQNMRKECESQFQILMALAPADESLKQQLAEFGEAGRNEE